jgi:hypothetical protein
VRTEMNFDALFHILSNEKFLNMEGLGNEVPFFVHSYDIADQIAVYVRLRELVNRLHTSGVRALLISLYDMVLEHFESAGELEELFEYERSVSKDEFRAEMHSYTNPDNLLRPYFASQMKEDEYRLVVVYQVGEVFPFMRTHNVLNNLQTVVTDMPLVVFFPGTYETSPEHGFKLSLFSKFPGPYYRAFKLEDYVIRGNIDA